MSNKRSGAFEFNIPLSGNPLDRADAQRDDEAALAAHADSADARILLLHEGKAPFDLTGAPKLAWAPVSTTRMAGAEPPIFLGLDNGAPRFSAALSAHDAPETLGLWETEPKFIDLRLVASELPVGEAGIMAQAKSLVAWHQSHRFCARCGAESVLSCGGWRRDCRRCDTRHFPRVDPVVIMLILRRDATGGEHVVLGRQHGWPEGLHSLLAGYVEPGETIEEAARRESFEESGVEIGAVRILASQPWPWPSTLMIGCYAEALTEALRPDEAELENVRWASRDEVSAALRGDHPALMAPRKDAIARILCEAWIDGVVLD